MVLRVVRLDTTVGGMAARESAGVRLRLREQARAAAENTFARLYRQLTPRQRAAVDAIEGPVMVLAGPGTGKTHVLTMRIANILRLTQMDPWNILCLTFTEAASSTMRNRLFEIIGEAAYHVRVTTFHAFCNDVLADHPDLFPAAAQWLVLSEVERVELFRELLDELPGDSPLKPFGHPYVYVSDLIRTTQWLKQEGVEAVRLRQLAEQSAAAGGALAEVLAPFLALPLAERDELACRAAAERAERTCRDLGADALARQVQVLTERYTATAAPGMREAGRARTRLKNGLKKLAEGLTTAVPRQAALAAIYARYQERLRELGRYDYEDMIMFVVERLREDDVLLSRLQEQWQYILVDEYQDTNGAQNEVLWRLGSFYPNPNIFVVGDDNQSIFRFQGASLENLLSFYEHYRDHVQVLSLTDNFRSQQTVLDAAGEVIAHNEARAGEVLTRLDRQLVARTGRRVPIERRVFASEDEEDFFVASRIQQLLQEGVPAHEIGVLYRYNRDAASLVDVLLRLDVPLHVAGGENVLADIRVRQLLRLLACVGEGLRDDVLADVLHYDFFELDPVDVLRVIHAAGKERCGIWRVLADQAKLAAAGVRQAAWWQAMGKRLAQWRSLAANVTSQQLFDVVLRESGLLQRVVDEGELRSLRHLTSLFDELRRLNRQDQGLTIRQFTDRLHLLEEHGVPLVADSWQTRADAVQALTAHRAKGLEFTHVFIIRLADRRWGNARERSRLVLPAGIVHHDAAAVGRNEEERRLFYVALTRARQRLYLSYARGGDGGRERAASLFWQELPAAAVKDVSTAETEAGALARAAVRLRPPRAAGPELRTWLAERLETYVLSVTHLNNYLACPRLWLYRNLLRVPAAKTRHLAFGTAVHSALRDLALAAGSDRLPAAAFVVERFEQYLQRETLTVTEARDALTVGRAVLRRYVAGRLAQWRLPVLVEYDFRAFDVRIAGVRVTGKVDKVEIIDEGQKLVNLVDYKTGNPDGAGKRLKRGEAYWRQMVFYRLLCEAAPQFSYRMVSAELDFVQPSARTGNLVQRRLAISSGDVAAVRSEIVQARADMTSLTFLERPGCEQCEYCRAAH